MPLRLFIAVPELSELVMSGPGESVFLRLNAALAVLGLCSVAALPLLARAERLAETPV